MLSVPFAFRVRFSRAGRAAACGAASAFAAEAAPLAASAVSAFVPVLLIVSVCGELRAVGVALRCFAGCAAPRWEKG